MSQGIQWPLAAGNGLLLTASGDLGPTTARNGILPKSALFCTPVCFLAFKVAVWTECLFVSLFLCCVEPGSLCPAGAGVFGGAGFLWSPSVSGDGCAGARITSGWDFAVFTVLCACLFFSGHFFMFFSAFYFVWKQFEK